MGHTLFFYMITLEYSSAGVLSSGPGKLYYPAGFIMQGRTCVSALFRGGKFSQRRKNLFVGPDPLVRPFSQGPGASGSRAFKNIKISS